MRNLSKALTWALFSAFFVVSLQSHAAIIYRADFETEINTSSTNPVNSGTIKRLNDACVLQDPQSYTYGTDQHVRRIQNVVRAGSYALTQIVQKGCDYRSSNPDGRQKPRVGLVPKKSAISLSAGQEYWIAFSFYLPTDYQFESNSNNRDNVFQIFKEDNRDNGANPFPVNIDRDILEIQAFNTGASANTLVENERTLTKGIWYDYVLHVKLQARAGSAVTPGTGGFFDIYLDYPGNPNDPQVPIMSGTGVNTEGDLHSLAFNLYKFNGYCTSAYQLNASQCPYSTATGYPAGTTNQTNWTGQRAIYFDEIRVGNSASSLAEVAPHFDASSPPAPSVSVVGMNQGAALTANKPSGPTETPVYFTTTGGNTSGVSRVSISDGTNSENALAVNSDATGGRFSTGSLTAVNGGPVTVSFEYDNPNFDSESTASGEVYNWTDSNATAEAYTSTLLEDYGYLDGAKVCNTGASYGFTLSPATVIATGRTVTVRAVAKGDTSNTMRMFVRAKSGATLLYNSVRGTFGSLAIDATQHGTGHTVTETVHNGLSFVEYSFVTNQVDYEYAVTFGPNSNTSGVCMVGLGARLWDNESVSTLTYSTTLDKLDTVAPSPSNCQIGAVSTTSASLGCDLDDATGTFYAVLTNSGTSPSLAQCKAGQDHTGAVALWSSNQSASNGTFTASNLDPYTDKYAYFCQTDAAANDSGVVAADAPIPAETPPSTTKKIAFRFAEGNDTSLACRSAQAGQASQYNSADEGSGDIFIVIGSGNPRPSPGGQFPTILAYDTNATIVNGEYDLDESDLEYGSINALDTGDQGYYMWGSNASGSCRWSAPVQVIAE